MYANKVRKSKTVNICNAMGPHFKQKKIAIEKYRKSEFNLTQTREQFIFNTMITYDIAKPNSFLYSNVLCLASNYPSVDHQFGRFTKYVQDLPEYMQNELSRLFGPLICHLYIELLKGKEYRPAAEFLKKYAYLVSPLESLPLDNDAKSDDKLFERFIKSSTPEHIIVSKDDIQTAPGDYFRDVIQIISSCFKIEVTESTDVIVFLRSAKCEIELSTLSARALQKYLSSNGHVVILNILETWIYFNVTADETDLTSIDLLEREEENVSETVDDGIHIKENNYDNMLHCNSNPMDQWSAQNKYAKKLEKSISKLKTVGISTRCIKVFEPDIGLTSANFDEHGCNLVAGFNNSLAKIWHLKDLDGINCIDEFVDATSGVDNEFRKQSIDEIPYDVEGFNSHHSFDISGGTYLKGHNRAVTDVRFSTHCSLLLSVSMDQTIRIWKPSNSKCIRTYAGHNYPIWCIDESPISEYFATGSKDQTARLWSLEREHPYTTYVGHTQDVDCLVFHPNGNYLATGSCDLSLRLWCATSGKLFRVFSDCKHPITSVSFSPNGRLLAAAGDESKIRIFDLAAGSQLAELKDHSSSVVSIAWNASGSKFASLCVDGSLRIWDVYNIGVQDNGRKVKQLSSNSLIGILWNMPGVSRGVKIHFNSDDVLSCIGS